MAWLDSFFQIGGTMTMVGDVTGPSNANTVAKFSGATVPGSPLASGGLFLVTGSSTTWTARAISAADLAALPVNGDFLKFTAGATAWAPITLSDVGGNLVGDVTGPALSNKVTTITGSAGVVALVATSITGGVLLSDAVAASATLQAQSAMVGAVTHTTGGSLTIKSGVNADNSTYGFVSVGPSATSFASGGAALGTTATNGSLEWVFIADAGRSGFALDASANANGYVNLRALGAGGTAGVYLDAATIYFRDRTSATAMSLAPNATGTTSLAIAAGVTGFTLGWANNTVASATGSPLTISGQNATGTTSTGGALFLRSGSGTSANGKITFQSAGTVLGTFNDGGLSDRWVSTLDPARTYLMFQATGATQNVVFSAGLSCQFQAPSLYFFDAGAGTTITCTLASAGTTSIAFASTVTSAQITASVGILLGSTTGVNQFVGGETRTTITVANTNRTLDTTTKDCVIFVDTTSATVALTLPAPVNGRRLRIIDIGGNLSVNNLTLAQHATEKINGLAASKVFTTNWGEWDVISNGTDWFVG